LASAIQTAISRILGVEPEPDADLHALGLTSMKATELAAALEAIVGRSLPVTIAFQHPSLASLTQHLTSALGDSPSRQESLQALSDAALAAAPQIDVYARLPFVHTPYLNTSMMPDYRSEVICTDRHGFRISHHPEGPVDSDGWPRRPNRAIAVGNSFLFGWGASSDAATIPSLLNAGGQRCFLNVATAGANSFQEVIAAAPFLAEAELVLIGGGVANLLRCLEYEPDNALYGGFVGREFHAFVRRLDFRHVLELLGQAPDPAAPISSAGREAAAALHRAMAEHAEGHARWLHQGWDADEVRRRFDLALALLRRDLALLVRAKRPGARILFAMQPTTTLAKPELTLEEQGLIAVHQHYNSMWRQVFEPYVRDLLPEWIDAVAGVCADLDLPFTDLNRLDYQGWCFCDQGHLLDRGNRVVAEHLADWIEQEGR
jgi:acyl carrier protein